MRRIISLVRFCKCLAEEDLGMIAKRQFTKNQKGQNIVEIHEHVHHELIHHSEEEQLRVGRMNERKEQFRLSTGLLKPRRSHYSDMVNYCFFIFLRYGKSLGDHRQSIVSHDD